MASPMPDASGVEGSVPAPARSMHSSRGCTRSSSGTTPCWGGAIQSAPMHHALDVWPWHDHVTPPPLPRSPKLVEIIAAVPEEHRAALLPQLKVGLDAQG